MRWVLASPPRLAGLLLATGSRLFDAVSMPGHPRHRRQEGLMPGPSWRRRQEGPAHRVSGDRVWEVPGLPRHCRQEGQVPKLSWHRRHEGPAIEWAVLVIVLGEFMCRCGRGVTSF